MPAKRVTALTLPVDTRAAVAFQSYTGRTPLLTILAVRPAVLVTLTLGLRDPHRPAQCEVAS